MTSQEIISEYFSVPQNINKLITIAYDEQIFNFIVATCECHSMVGYPNIYNVNGSYQKIICKTPNENY